MLTHSFWQRAYGGDPAIIGRSLRLDDRPFEVVGVLPKLDVSFPSTAHDLWVPLIAQPGVFWQQQRGTGWVTALARVKPGVSPETAEQELSIVSRRTTAVLTLQTIALYQGFPVFGFHTSVVARWLVTPIAARSSAVMFALRMRAQ